MLVTPLHMLYIQEFPYAYAKFQTTDLIRMSKLLSQINKCMIKSFREQREYIFFKF